MDRRGQIWLGTMGGAVQFTPNKNPPPVYITQMIADETYTNPKGTIQLSSGVRRLSFFYHAISFKTRPGGMKYFYQLVGKDADWQGPTNQDTVEYFNLKPGKYTFKVQAVDRDLNYSFLASLDITIPLPFYMKVVFLVPTVGLGASLLAMLIILATALVKHRRQVRAYERLAVQELQDAREMQMSLLPETNPSVKGFEFYGFSQPAREVGGDFYDYLTLDTDLIGIALADVSGKGLRAAMNAVMINGMLHEAAKSEQTSAQLLSVLNAGLCVRLQRFTKIAFALFILDPQVNMLTYANAGQPLPIVKRKENVGEALLIGGLPLGSMADFEYEENRIKLQAGDYVILYTDGISEAMNEAKEMYTEERLIEAIRQAGVDISAEEMIQHILQDVMAFVGNAPQYDDMTLVVVRCFGDFSGKD